MSKRVFFKEDGIYAWVMGEALKTEGGVAPQFTLSQRDLGFMRTLLSMTETSYFALRVYLSGDGLRRLRIFCKAFEYDTLYSDSQIPFNTGALSLSEDNWLIDYSSFHDVVRICNTVPYATGQVDLWVENKTLKLKMYTKNNEDSVFDFPVFGDLMPNTKPMRFLSSSLELLDSFKKEAVISLEFMERRVRFASKSGNVLIIPQMDV